VIRIARIGPREGIDRNTGAREGGAREVTDHPFEEGTLGCTHRAFRSLASRRDAIAHGGSQIQDLDGRLRD
jgi:hypothetical protein